jgi:hypothetical protein
LSTPKSQIVGGIPDDGDRFPVGIVVVLRMKHPLAVHDVGRLRQDGPDTEDLRFRVSEVLRIDPLMGQEDPVPDVAFLVDLALHRDGLVPFAQSVPAHDHGMGRADGIVSGRQDILQLLVLARFRHVDLDFIPAAFGTFGKGGEVIRAIAPCGIHDRKRKGKNNHEGWELRIHCESPPSRVDITDNAAAGR